MGEGVRRTSANRSTCTAPGRVLLPEYVNQPFQYIVLVFLLTFDQILEVIEDGTLLALSMTPPSSVGTQHLRGAWNKFDRLGFAIPGRGSGFDASTRTGLGHCAQDGRQ